MALAWTGKAVKHSLRFRVFNYRRRGAGDGVNWQFAQFRRKHGICQGRKVLTASEEGAIIGDLVFQAKQYDR